MNEFPILTIAVPTYNMECCLEKNLSTFQDDRFESRLEVICIDNSSTDKSKDIIERFCNRWPKIFRMINKQNDGYGSSINVGISEARGRFFKIVDADDWVNTEELLKLIEKLEQTDADVILTDFSTVSLQTQKTVRIPACGSQILYGKLLTSLSGPTQTLPSMHATTYRTALLHDFRVQEHLYFVDEEYIILPYLHVRTVLYLPFNVYQYQIANPNQSTSPQNRAKYQSHREQILRRLIREYQSICHSKIANRDALEYCKKRIACGVGDHFTTLYIYYSNRKEGRMLANLWKCFLKREAPIFFRATRKKAVILAFLNLLHISLPQYECLKSIAIKVLH